MTYKFSYQKEKYGDLFLCGVKDCKYPKKTGLFKALMNKLDLKEIHSFEYENISEDKKHHGFIKV